VRGVAGVGTFFWFQGAVLILPFAWLELAAVGVAFVVYARHAADGEHILLQGRGWWWSWKRGPAGAGGIQPRLGARRAGRRTTAR
jgi:hypothetical protein